MSFWEFTVVLVVGLLVIGPEKLPETIRTGMLWFGRVKRAVNDTRAEFEQQLGVDEIRRELHNERVMESLRKLEAGGNEIGKTLKGELSDVEAEVEDINSAVNKTIAPEYNFSDNLDDEMHSHHHETPAHDEANTDQADSENPVDTSSKP